MKLLLTAVLFLSAVVADKSYSGYKVLEVTPRHPSQLRMLTQLADNQDSGVSFLSYVRKEGLPISVQVSPDRLQHFRRLVSLYNLEATEVIDDMGRLIEQERAGRNEGDHFDLHKYNTYEQITDWLESLPGDYESVTLETIGQSVEKNDIMAVKISSGGENRPVILIDAGIHAREWIAPAVAVNIIHYLLSDDGTDSESLLDDFDFYIIPSLNPDGYEYTFAEDREWRKNRHAYEQNVCTGVDLNRNFGYHWGGKGSSGLKCSEEYRGEQAFSEPESQALKSFSLKYKDTIKMYVSLHSYSQLVLYPFGYAKHLDPPANEDELLAIGQAMVDAIKDTHGRTYTLENSVELYPASGASDDWMMASLDDGGAGIRESFTVELRPQTALQGGFLLDASQIQPTSEEVWAGLVAGVGQLKQILAESE